MNNHDKKKKDDVSCCRSFQIGQTVYTEMYMSIKNH